jgi:hypothetical protein
MRNDQKYSVFVILQEDTLLDKILQGVQFITGQVYFNNGREKMVPLPTVVQTTPQM